MADRQVYELDAQTTADYTFLVVVQKADGALEAQKMTIQELRELAEGFHNEVAPTSMEIEGRVVRLSGSLEQRYGEWRRILREIYALETGG